MECYNDVPGTACHSGLVLYVVAKPVSSRDKDNQRLLALIRDFYSLSRSMYGYPMKMMKFVDLKKDLLKNKVY